MDPFSQAKPGQTTKQSESTEQPVTVERITVTERVVPEQRGAQQTRDRETSDVEQLRHKMETTTISASERDRETSRHHGQTPGEAVTSEPSGVPLSSAAGSRYEKGEREDTTVRGDKGTAGPVPGFARGESIRASESEKIGAGSVYATPSGLVAETKPSPLSSGAPQARVYTAGTTPGMSETGGLDVSESHEHFPTAKRLVAIAVVSRLLVFTFKDLI
jgi:hypothetical protein